MQELSKFDPPKAIEEAVNKVSKYKGLAITGPEDKEGYEAVRVAIGECVSTRTGFVATCKAAREEANKYAKFVIEQERTGVAAIEEIENALRASKQVIDDEKERVKAEKEARIQERVRYMSEKLDKVGYDADWFELRDMSEAKFEELLKEQTAKFELRKAFDEFNAELNSYRVPSVTFERFCELDAYERSDFLSAFRTSFENNEAKRVENERIEKEKAEEERVRLETERKKLDEERACFEEHMRTIAEEERVKREELESERNKVFAEKAELERKRQLEEASESARKEEAKRIENERLAEEERKKRELQDLEKKRKYAKFLSDNGCDESTKHLYKPEQVGNSVILWKRVAVYNQ